MGNGFADNLQKNIDLPSIFREVKRKLPLLIGIILSFVAIAIIYSSFFVIPTYSTCAKIYISNKSSDQISTSDLSISSYLTKDYSELIVDRTVLNVVIEELNLAYSYNRLKSCISVVNPESTRILEVHVNTPDPAASQEIADKVCEVAQKKIVELLNVDRVNIFSKAYLPTSAIKLGVGKASAYALVLGVAVCAVLVVVFYCINDKICDEEDVERYLGLCVLGVIPYSQSRAMQGGMRKRSVKSRNGSR